MVVTAETTWSAEPFLPPTRDLEALRVAATVCRGCDLYRIGTQTVFGAGPRRARLLLVGEQPGDAEDLAGKPFVGPAGRLLDEALGTAGIDRSDVYVTNAVKHFKWTPKGKRRIHAKPDLLEVAACRPWLDAELAAVRPEVTVCLGATAAQSLLGKGFLVTKRRSEFLEWPPGVHATGVVTATVHPSSILRAGDRRADELAKFVADLEAVADRLSKRRTTDR
jgi:DNA polymerase